MRTFPFISIPFSTFCASITLQHKDSQPYFLDSHLQLPDSLHSDHSHPDSPHSYHSHPDSPHFHHSPHSVPWFPIWAFADSLFWTGTLVEYFFRSRYPFRSVVNWILAIFPKISRQSTILQFYLSSFCCAYIFPSKIANHL